MNSLTIVTAKSVNPGCFRAFSGRIESVGVFAFPGHIAMRAYRESNTGQCQAIVRFQVRADKTFHVSLEGVVALQENQSNHG